QLSLPEKSYEALDGMVAHVESIVKALELPYASSDSAAATCPSPRR
ncbi:hypothetical protein LEA_20434, partial [human gut metagenome]